MEHGVSAVRPAGLPPAVPDLFFSKTTSPNAMQIVKAEDVFYFSDMNKNSWFNTFAKAATRFTGRLAT